jgi:hypothetical protein
VRGPWFKVKGSWITALCRYNSIMEDFIEKNTPLKCPCGHKFSKKWKEVAPGTSFKCPSCDGTLHLQTGPEPPGDVQEGPASLGLTGKFSAANEEYVAKKKEARAASDLSELNHAHEKRRNEALAVRDALLREKDLENSKQVDAAIADLERRHQDFLRQLRGW